MTTLSIFSGGDSATMVTVANTTGYESIVGRGIVNAVENSYISMREAGSFTDLYLRLTANGIAAVSTFVMRDNSISVNNIISTTASTTGEYEDTTPHTDTITAGHKYNIMFTPGASTGTVTISAFRTLFNTTTNTATRLAFTAGSGGTAYTAASTTYYFTLNGSTGGLNTNEALSKSRQRLVGTMQNMYLVCSGNTRSVACTMNSRIDTGGGSANGNMSISVTASTNGLFEDITVGHTDAVSAGNDFNYSFSTGSDTGHAVTIWDIGCSFLSTTGYTYCYAGNLLGSSPATTSIRYFILSGNLGATSTESTAQQKAGENKQFSQMTINLSANSTGTGTMHFRNNAANGNQVVSVTASTTGNNTDSTNVDYVASTDEINYSYTAGASSGVTIQYMESWAVKAYTYPSSDTTSISDSKQRNVIRQSQPIFVHTYN